MSKNHAWRSSGNVVMARIGLATIATAVVSTAATATMRQEAPDPVVLVQSEGGALPAVTDDKSLVNISPTLEPAPEIFDGKAKAVWDGRGTLKGVWIAHPLAKTAHRVRIYNLENGAVVDGAMFKRESIAGDRRVIVSSDTAGKLGLEPNVAARLRIVGVRAASDVAGDEPAADDAGAKTAAESGEETASEARTAEVETKPEAKADGETAKAVPEVKTAESAADKPPVKAAATEAKAEAKTDAGAKPTAESTAEKAAHKADAGKPTTFKLSDDKPVADKPAKDKPATETAKAAAKVAAELPGPTVFETEDPVVYAERTTDLPPIPRARPAEPAYVLADGTALSDRAMDVMAATRAAAGFKFVPDTGSDTRLAGLDGFFTRAVEPAAAVSTTDEKVPTETATDIALLNEPGSGKADDEDLVFPAPDAAATRLPNDPGTPLKLTADTKPAAFKTVPEPAPADKPAAAPKAEPAAKKVEPAAEPPAEKLAALTPAPKTAVKAPEKAPEVKPAAVKALMPVAPKPAGDEAKAAEAPETGLSRPFVQVGLFGVPENAERLVGELKAKGIPAVVKPFSAGGKDFSRVLVGPFKDQASRDRVQKMVRDLGLTDAISVKG